MAPRNNANVWSLVQEEGASIFFNKSHSGGVKFCAENADVFVSYIVLWNLSPPDAYLMAFLSGAIGRKKNETFQLVDFTSTAVVMLVSKSWTGKKKGGKGWREIYLRHESRPACLA